MPVEGVGTVYGPFFDEELFFYYDKTPIEIDLLQIYETDVGFIGFDRLSQIYAKGKAGSFDNVMFSGRATLKKTSCLCEGGLKKLLRQVQQEDPTMNPQNLQEACKQGDIVVEILCQLAVMPVCYLAKSPVDSIVIYSRNQNSVNNQRRYIVKTFHVACFRRSELTLHRFFVLKFIIDACKLHGAEVPREKRDVHWLVKVYMENYSKVFKKHGRPRLHRSEVYDHFAIHAEWLRFIFSHKLLVDREKWDDWVIKTRSLKSKAKRAGVRWGIPIVSPVSPLLRRRQPTIVPSQEYSMDIDYSEVIVNLPGSESDPCEGGSSPSSSESESDGGDAPYDHDPQLRSRVQPNLLLPMPAPTWRWACNINNKCPFVIDIGNGRARESPCMEPLNEKEKAYILTKPWGLHSKRLVRIWKKMCQAHMDWHWRKEAGLVFDHERRLIYSVEEDEIRRAEEDELRSDEDELQSV